MHAPPFRSKLLVNVAFNAVNALSGQRSRATASDPGWRYLCLRALDEGQAALDRRGIAYAHARGDRTAAAAPYRSWRPRSSSGWLLAAAVAACMRRRLAAAAVRCGSACLPADALATRSSTHSASALAGPA